MGKSSSSSKKIKHSKLRSVKKKKTKRNKSKKIRRIRDYSDESESSGSDSSLYSTSSEDDYRREKRRSKVSKKKKRSRKRYSSSESDDDTRLLKKKKRSERKDEHVGTKKKKVSSRKRRKRDSSSSSTGSDNVSGDGSESDGKRRTMDRGRLDKVKAESEEEVEDEVMTEKSNSRRLKSIVVVSYSYGNDERKEDMVDDHDDESYEDKIVDDGRVGDDESGGKAFGYDEFEEDNDSSETSKSSYPDNSLKDDDLEAILKQRALENLKRFRGEAQKSGIARKEASSLQTESETIEKSQDHSLIEQKLCVSAESKDLETSQKILQVVNVNESGKVLANVASQQSGDTAKVKASSGISSCTTKRKLIRHVLGQESLNLASRKEDAEAESISGSTLDKNVPESSLTLARKNGAENIEQTEEVSSTLNTETLDEIKGGGSQSEQKTNDETKDESQYEKKTMTVMRGGEMVQVSYKVYIPKKSSSLGRRQLKR
uniref:Uncharacterized protein n=1 Tax=Noccaea caerulescens TaxID=107243 RepID=A0A1J3JBQ4_NOCCA